MEKMIQKNVVNTVVTVGKIDDMKLELLGKVTIAGVRAGVDTASKRAREEYGDSAIVVSMHYEEQQYKLPLSRFIECATKIEVED